MDLDLHLDVDLDLDLDLDLDGAAQKCFRIMMACIGSRGPAAAQLQVVLEQRKPNILLES